MTAAAQPWAAAAMPVTSTSSSTTSTTTLPEGFAAALAPTLCAQPVTSGELPKATDCLFILNVGVGIGACVPSCICDVNGDFSENASDALLCLKIAVGIDLPRECPCPTTTTSTTMGSGTGPCCSRGTCSITTPEGCRRGNYLGDSDSVGNCSAEELIACNAPPTTTTSTTTTTLPQPTGACCLRSRCFILTADDCAGGTYLGDSDSVGICSAEEEAVCNPPTTTTTSTTTTTLPQPTGACCIRGRRCQILTFEDCAGGTYLGDSDSVGVCSAEEEALCNPPTTTTTSTTTTTLPPVTGACCIRGRCLITTPEDCGGGLYLGDSDSVGSCSPEEEAMCP